VCFIYREYWLVVITCQYFTVLLKEHSYSNIRDTLREEPITSTYLITLFQRITKCFLVGTILRFVLNSSQVYKNIFLICSNTLFPSTYTVVSLIIVDYQGLIEPLKRLCYQVRVLPPPLFL
jgi:hypothetical protein